MLQEPKMGSFKLSKGWSFSSFAKTFPNHYCNHHGINKQSPSFALLIYSSQRHLVRQSFMYLASWWFQPLWTCLIRQHGNLPQPNRGGKKKRYLKPPPSWCFCALRFESAKQRRFQEHITVGRCEFPDDMFFSRWDSGTPRYLAGWH